MVAATANGCAYVRSMAGVVITAFPVPVEADGLAAVQFSGVGLAPLNIKGTR